MAFPFRIAIGARIIGTGTTDSRQITNQRTCPYDPKKTIELICELERLVGKQCYNPQSYNGYTGEEGCIMRYPVYYCNKDGEDCKTKILVKDITKNCIGSIHYKFGANHLYIGDAIVDMLNYIEDKYNIDFNEIVKNKK